MTYILKNKNIELHIDSPLENYQFSRFDWTGKIKTIKFKESLLTTFESANSQNEHTLGKGIYNEFGIDKPLGFDETPINGWFHKIGIGLLQKKDSLYKFDKKYTIQPATFKITRTTNQVRIACESDCVNGYSYQLKKEITLQTNGFTIDYYLENTGEKEIITDEYTHNFTSIHQDFIGSNYHLKFPFNLKPLSFEETVNPEKKVAIGVDDIKFTGDPKEQFFFSNLSGDEKVAASWELIHSKSNISMREIGNFKTDKINVWGWQHVICPELFFKISLKTGQSTSWTRRYDISIKK